MRKMELLWGDSISLNSKLVFSIIKIDNKCLLMPIGNDILNS